MNYAGVDKLAVTGTSVAAIASQNAFLILGAVVLIVTGLTLWRLATTRRSSMDS